MWNFDRFRDILLKPSSFEYSLEIKQQEVLSHGEKDYYVPTKTNSDSFRLQSSLSIDYDGPRKQRKKRKIYQYNNNYTLRERKLHKKSRNLEGIGNNKLILAIEVGSAMI